MTQFKEFFLKIKNNFKNHIHEILKPYKQKKNQSNRIRMAKMITDSCNKYQSDFYFIQIGSNDGVSGDPIYKYVTKYNLKGILVEPVEYLFNLLKKNYSTQKNVHFENAAISNKDGLYDFYWIKENNEPNMPQWYKQVGNLNKNIISGLGWAFPNLDKYLIKSKIKCISFSTLLKKYNVKRLDLLHMDIEGYEYEILKSIPFEHIRPKMILYEHKVLSRQDQEKSKKLLKKEGYKTFSVGEDTFAYLRYNGFFAKISELIKNSIKRIKND